ncbi:MAG: hypothetical protein KDA32_12485 [Phycisphaerales bacterium]|nr:hypothetical protein [Phycisphaerales bacterium]
MILLIIATATSASHAGVVFVDDDAAPFGDGSSWGTAFDNLQTALLDPNTHVGDEIWVAVGIYRPADPNGSRYASFTLRAGINLHGGFAADPNDPNRLDPTGASILSGDLRGNDTEGDPNDPNRSENSIHVVDGQQLEAYFDPNDPNDPNSLNLSVTRVSRFTIQGGQANGSTPELDGGGAGLFADGGRYIDCVFRWNVAKGLGGGALIRAGASIERSSFYQNHAAQGGGVYAGLRSRYDECTFLECQAEARTATDGLGGGLAAVNQQFIYVRNCNFVANSARVGAGLFTDKVTPITIRDSSFCSNDANEAGGGLAITDYTTGKVAGCTITSNSARIKGGGIFHSESHEDEFSYSQCLIRDNVAAADANQLSDGGGFYFFRCENTPLIDCLLLGNSATGLGGAIYNRSNSEPNDEPARGNSDPVIRNCTVTGNTAGSSGGGMFSTKVIASNAPTPKVRNSIFWGNSGGEIVDSAGSATTVDYSDIEGSWSGVGSNNINSDPRFSDPAAGDLRPVPVSPVIDAGSNASPISPYDFAGATRIVDGDGAGGAVVDMGAYEFQGTCPSSCPEDIDASHQVDLSDLAALLASFGLSSGDPGYNADTDFDSSGTVDLSDLAALLSKFGEYCCFDPITLPTCSSTEESFGPSSSGPSFFGPMSSSGPAVTLEVDGFDTSGYTGGGFAGESDHFVFDLLITVSDPNDDWTSNGATVDTLNGATLRLAPYDPNDPNSDPEPTGAGEPNKYVCFVGVPKGVNVNGRFNIPGASYAGGFNGGDEFTYTTTEFDVAWFDTSGTSNDGPAVVMRIVIDVSGVSGADTSSGSGSVYYSETGPATAGDIEVATFAAATGVDSLGATLTTISGSFYAKH